MSDITTINTGYLSDFYADSSTDANVQQTLEYNFVKAFPSAYSSNDGPVYSESNARWFTKQFTKKPFIIPHDGNPTADMFKDSSYGTSSGLNGTYTYGGMANIDGYIFSIANDVNNIYFDNRNGVYFGSNGAGLIITQIAQQTLMKLNATLVDCDLRNYLNPIYVSGNDIDLSSAYTTLLTDDDDKVEIGTVVVEYTDSDSKSFIESLITLDNSRTPSEQKGYADIFEYNNNKYTATYTVYLGYPNNFYKQSERIGNRTIYRPFIFIEDGFGCIYTFSNSNDRVARNDFLTTHTYPSTYDNRIGIQNLASEISSPTSGSSYLHGNIIQKMLPDDSVSDITSIYDSNGRDSSQTPTSVTLTTVYNKYKAVTITDMLSYTPLTTITSMPLSSDVLPDIEYCIKEYGGSTFSTQFEGVLAYLSRTYNTVSIPVGIMNSAGRLTPYNIDIYVDESTTRNIYTTVEGYVTFLRRISANLLNCPTQTTFGDIVIDPTYIGNPNGDSFTQFTNTTIVTDLNAFYTTWTNVFRALEIYGVQKNLDALVSDVFGGDSSALYTFFGVNSATSYSDIKFHHIFNTLITPFINNYLQIAWTSLYSNTVNTGNSNKFVPNKALTILRNNNVPIVNDEYWQGNVALKHDYTVTGGTHIASNYNYIVNNDIYTDKTRLNNFLCGNTKQSALTVGTTSLIDYRLPKSSIELADCDDYIGYIKSCTRTTNDLNYSATFGYSDFENVVIPYKITNLDCGTLNINVDNDFVYGTYPTTTSSYSQSADPSQIPNVNTENSYIQNVKIDTHTMLPVTSPMGFWQDNGGTYTMVLNVSNYNLSITTLLTQQRITSTYTETFTGLDGLSFKGYTQQWVTYLPTVFRLYKDSQNYLLGKDADSINTDGIAIDYKFPKEINDTDLWFNMIWLKLSRSVGSWNIESNGASKPENTDKLLTYLENRTSTIFNMDKIYTIQDGNYLTLEQYITEQINSDKTKIKYNRDEGTSIYGTIITPNSFTLLTTSGGGYPSMRLVTPQNFTFKETNTVEKCYIKVRTNLTSGIPSFKLKIQNIVEGIQDTWITPFAQTYDSTTGQTEISITYGNTGYMYFLIELTFTPDGNICTATEIPDTSV